MSQEKVDKYKKEKANRKKLMKKEKLENAVRKCVVALIGLLLVCWIGYSAYDVYDSGKEPEKAEVDYQAFNDFPQDITEAAAQAAAAQEAEAQQ